MCINLKTCFLAGIGLVIVFTMLGAKVSANRPSGEPAPIGGQMATPLENINTSDNATWLAEYESDGVNGAGGVPAEGLAVRETAFPILLLIITGVLLAGVERHKLNQTKQLSQDG